STFNPESRVTNVADHRRQGAVRENQMLPCAGYGIEKSGRVRDLAADSISLILDQQRPLRFSELSPANPTPYQHCGIVGIPPIGTVERSGDRFVDGGVRSGETFDHILASQNLGTLIRARLSAPDTLCALRVNRIEIGALTFEFRRKPRILAPVHLQRNAIWWSVRHETAIRRIILFVGIQGRPDFGPRLADGRNQDFPRT